MSIWAKEKEKKKKLILLILIGDQVTGHCRRPQPDSQVPDLHWTKVLIAPSSKAEEEEEGHRKL